MKADARCPSVKDAVERTSAPCGRVIPQVCAIASYLLGTHSALASMEDTEIYKAQLLSGHDHLPILNSVNFRQF